MIKRYPVRLIFHKELPAFQERVAQLLEEAVKERESVCSRR
ncbi:MAG: hypothetical protein H6Q60_1507 [Oscillospiraceae bacterium]|nr:hypothetical protein [Oscillospiraceae bacterium]